MASKILNAMRIGGYAHGYFAADTHEGRVATTFRHGLSAVFGGDVYVSIQTPAVPLHPWAVEVPGMPVRPAVGCAVRGTQFAVETAGTRFELLTGAREPVRMAPYSPANALTATDNRGILNRLLHERRPRSVEAFEGEIRAVVAQWQTTGDPSLLANLVGLGSGSTPSGDDVLVGILAGLTALFDVSASARQHLEALREGLREVSHRTHPASRQMLAAATDGSFPEPLLNLARALGGAGHPEAVRAAAARVLGLGATSGGSFLAGLAAALDANP
ncbi:MAG: DUF2877 domain-containing protein [Candidatus Bipolaricaulis sp.]|nr:DUF2877 domain-containing protein [Candidatus Bipolaricaulis sp.]